MHCSTYIISKSLVSMNILNHYSIGSLCVLFCHCHHTVWHPTHHGNTPVMLNHNIWVSLQKTTMIGYVNMAPRWLASPKHPRGLDLHTCYHVNSTPPLPAISAALPKITQRKLFGRSRASLFPHPAGVVKYNFSSTKTNISQHEVDHSDKFM